MLKDTKKIDALLLFLFFFCYSITAALLFQKVLLPHFMGSVNGLVEGDAVYFNQVAVGLAHKIKEHGWGEWTIFPAMGAGGNVAILAAMYVFFSPDISLVLPINAVLHALSGVLIYLLGRTIWPGRVGKLAGTLAAIAFVVFPSSLNWYAQVHKDGYVITGTLLIIYVWVLIELEYKAINFRNILLLILSGVILVIFAKPYHLKIIFAFASMLWLARVVWLMLSSTLKFEAKPCLWQLLILIILAVAVVIAPKGDNQEQLYANWQSGTTGTSTKWEWKNSNYVPASIEHYFEMLARTRAGLISSGISVNASSLIDQDVNPNNVPALIQYIPRAMQISLFAPFPDNWFEKISASRLVAIAEMLIWYLIAPGMLLAIWQLPFRRMYFVIGFSMGCLVLYGLTLANVGTLYRIRYVYIILMMLVSFAGWLEFFYKRYFPQNRKIDVHYPAVEADINSNASEYQKPEKTSSLVTAGMSVALAMIFSYAGLLLRDILMARQFGLNGELDAFVLATLIPMFLVTVVAAPIGSVIVPQYLKLKSKYSNEIAQQFVNKVALLFILLAVLLGVVFALSGYGILKNTVGASPTTLHDAWHMMGWMLLVFFFSGPVVLANGLLNALGKYLVPAMAQAIVPVFAIVGLLGFGERYGAIVVVIAMFLGQFANLLVVRYVLSKEGLSVAPSFSRHIPIPWAFLGQYLPLVVAAFFMNISSLISISIASSLPAGNIAAVGLANKVVIVLMGLLDTILATIVLPHFARILAKGQHSEARKNLSSMLLIGTTVSIPVTFLLYLLAEPFITLVFQGGAFNSSNTDLVANVLSFGILQAPFFVINVLLLKFAIAKQYAGRVMLVALSTVFINVQLSYLLVAHMGAPGLALSITLSTAFSATLMLIIFYKMKHVSFVDFIFIVSNWMLFLCMVICAHFSSYAGMVSAAIAFIVLLLGEWREIFVRKLAGI